MADGDERDKSNSRAVQGILFFGVPSQGIDISSTLPMVQGKANESFLRGLRPDSEILRSQQREFCKSFPYKSCKIVSFFETEYSPTARRVKHNFCNFHSRKGSWYLVGIWRQLENERRASSLGGTFVSNTWWAVVGGWMELLSSPQIKPLRNSQVPSPRPMVQYREICLDRI